MPEKNRLFYGDNLDVLREHIKDETVDLVYLDPPFNSNVNYNVLFKEHGTDAAAQIQAFEDTWKWDENAAHAYQEIVVRSDKVAQALRAFRELVGETDMLAYLSMMAPRLVELRRVLKPTGSIYLHCDPTASHYLKLLMDAVFSASNFRTELIWKRSSAHSDAKQGRRQHGHIHDVILFYTRTEKWEWNHVFTKYDPEYVDRRFKNSDSRGRYKDADLSAAKPGGDTAYDWRVKRKTGGTWTHDLRDEWRNPKANSEYKAVKPPRGRYWAYSKENLRSFAEQDLLHYFSSGTPRLKQYVDEMEGVSLQDIWTDVPVINAKAAERLGYPTQKPLALLERIISSSSNLGDLVLDPFCGCGTTIDAAQKLGRRWIGIDITFLATNLIKHRLLDTYGEGINKTYDVIGEPNSVPDARILAEQDPFQFQWWALGLVGARPVEQKKGADKGIDGRLFFHEGNSDTKQVVLSVKGGKNVQVKDVRDLVGVVEREKAAIGVLITMHNSTQPMRAEAANAGFYESPWGKHPKVQIVTVRELLEGKRIDMPQVTGANVTFKKAAKHRGPGASQCEIEM